MALESDAVAGATIELLEARLRRLTYLLTGATDWTGVPTAPEKPTSLDETVSRKLARLERELERLSRSVPAVRDVLQLRMCSAVQWGSDTFPFPSCTQYLPTAHDIYTLSSTPSFNIQCSPIQSYKKTEHNQLTPKQTTKTRTSSNKPQQPKSPKA
jgi:hypothetical protein